MPACRLSKEPCYGATTKETTMKHEYTWTFKAGYLAFCVGGACCLYFLFYLVGMDVHFWSVDWSDLLFRMPLLLILSLMLIVAVRVAICLSCVWSTLYLEEESLTTKAFRRSTTVSFGRPFICKYRDIFAGSEPREKTSATALVIAQGEMEMVLFPCGLNPPLDPVRLPEPLREAWLAYDPLRLAENKSRSN